MSAKLYLLKHINFNNITFLSNIILEEHVDELMKIFTITRKKDFLEIYGKDKLEECRKYIREEYKDCFDDLLDNFYKFCFEVVEGDPCMDYNLDPIKIYNSDEYKPGDVLIDEKNAYLAEGNGKYNVFKPVVLEGYPVNMWRHLLIGNSAMPVIVNFSEEECKEIEANIEITSKLFTERSYHWYIIKSFFHRSNIKYTIICLILVNDLKKDEGLRTAIDSISYVYPYIYLPDQQPTAIIHYFKKNLLHGGNYYAITLEEYNDSNPVEYHCDDIEGKEVEPVRQLILNNLPNLELDRTIFIGEIEPVRGFDRSGYQSYETNRRHHWMWRKFSH